MLIMIIEIYIYRGLVSEIVYSISFAKVHNTKYIPALHDHQTNDIFLLPFQSMDLVHFEGRHRIILLGFVLLPLPLALQRAPSSLVHSFCAIYTYDLQKKERVMRCSI